MKKFLLIFGLLTYSSVGWSFNGIYECFFEDGSSTVYKKEPTLISYRLNGKWTPWCKKINDTGFSQTREVWEDGGSCTVVEEEGRTKDTTTITLDLLLSRMTKNVDSIDDGTFRFVTQSFRCQKLK